MKCDECGKTLVIGDFPFCPHGKPPRSKGFEPFYDVGLDQTVTGMGDINKACRPRWEDDHIVQLQPRDKSEGYYRELNERRRERAEAEKRERR